ncbi:MAG: cadmium-translocating P-type ATPase [Proteobacteria bacterium]|nr:cadmium-translocating P-type ATPase [Pseudomonadota bacterium]
MGYENLRSPLNWHIWIFVLLLFILLVSVGIDFTNIGPIFSLSVSDFLLLLVIVICGVPLLFEIFLKLLKRDLGADFLAILAVVTATILGQYLAGTIVLLMLVSGQILESYAIRRASSVLLALSKRMPSIAHRKIGKIMEEISIDQIQVGDEIVIFPHEICPVDGTVIEGSGSMDESYLTGEPYFVPKVSGVAVLSGAINGDNMITIRADKLPHDSRYAKIMKVMEESEQKRPKIRRLGDQLGAIFAPLALGGALFSWAISGDPIRFLAVLVIATPCPLLIAIPITIISAISLAAKRGIIIKDPVVLERLPTCQTAIFDKTGTLTYGRAELESIIPFLDFTKEDILKQVASIERFSKHPLSEAVLKAAKRLHLDFSHVDHVSEIPGEGLIGSIKEQKIEITSRKNLFIKAPEQAVNLPPVAPGMESIILINNELAAVLRFRDTLREEGYSFISHLAPIHHFKKIMIVSGDRPSEVEYLASQLNIKDVYASQTPEEKVALVRAEANKAPTLFMGDGINDAPALTTATVGIAFGNQNIIATEAAGAVILESSLSKVDELMHLSNLLRRTALMSAGGGMFLSIVGMYFAGIGIISPVAGALLQEGIDVIAILYALQLTWRSKIFVDIKASNTTTA